MRNRKMARVEPPDQHPSLHTQNRQDGSDRLFMLNQRASSRLHAARLGTSDVCAEHSTSSGGQEQKHNMCFVIQRGSP